MMSEEQFKSFLEVVKADAELQKKLKAAVDFDGVVKIAKAAGFEFSADELKRAQAEVSEEELEGVAGGTFAVVTGVLAATGTTGTLATITLRDRLGRTCR